MFIMNDWLFYLLNLYLSIVECTEVKKVLNNYIFILQNFPSYV